MAFRLCSCDYYSDGLPASQALWKDFPKVVVLSSALSSIDLNIAPPKNMYTNINSHSPLPRESARVGRRELHLLSKLQLISLTRADYLSGTLFIKKAKIRLINDKGRKMR